jgi:aspartyl/asparaginyl beta-hydroxylase
MDDQMFTTVPFGQSAAGLYDAGLRLDGRMSAAALAPQIARLAAVDSECLEQLRREALGVRGNWTAEYGEYQSGGWWTTSLMNESGDPDDVLIRDCEPVATTLLQRMRHTHRFLEGLGLRCMWARLARLNANAFLWEHIDYGELRPAERCRLHVPLSTNASAYMTVGSYRIHLRPGWIWRLEPTYRHGACNLYGPDRIHLIIDCYMDEELHGRAADAVLEGEDIQPLPAGTAPELGRHAAAARQLLSLGYPQSAEKHLLRLFYLYSLPPGWVYDMIAAQYQSAGSAEAADSWRRKKNTLLGIRHDAPGNG